MPPRRTASEKHKLIIAIDGPAGSGKSTVAKLIAQTLKIPYVDTGAMYRSVTLKAMQKGADLTDKKTLLAIAKKVKIRLSPVSGGKQRVFLDGKNVTKAIRTPELTQNVFYIAREPLVRREMVRQQRMMGRSSGAVMEGRDIGTVVFPKADFKFYLVADPRVRARRRLEELITEGKKASLWAVLKDIIRRDRHDKTRKEGPLRKAKDAFRLDTSPLTIEGVVARILAVVKAGGKGCS